MTLESELGLFLKKIRRYCKSRTFGCVIYLTIKDPLILL